MKLVEMEIIPQNKEGWGSGVLQFSSFITQLFGDNGTGKTPIVKSFSYALGNSCEFRDEIYLRCKSVRLRIESKGEIYELYRYYSRLFQAIAITPNGKTLEFHNEGDYSSFIFKLFGLASPNLVSNNGEQVRAYTTCLLPIYYVEQNEGYSNFYSAKSIFIKDQFSEMVRLAAGLAQKNSFSKVKDKALAKERVELAIKDYVRIQRQYEKVLERLETPYTNSINVAEKMEAISNELELLQSEGAGHSDASGLIENEIKHQKKVISQLKLDMEELNRIIDSNTQFSEEIESEIDTLSLNEEAKRIFMSFDEICSVEGCGMFLKSSDAYSKNLIYLKDQIKDIELISKAAQKNLSKKKVQFNIAQSTLNNLLEAREQALISTPLSNTLSSVRRLTRELVKCELEMSFLEEKEKLESLLVDRHYERQAAEEFLDSLSKKGDSETLSVIKFKSRIQRLLPIWLLKLNTSNVPRSAEIQHDFKAKFGGESLSKFDGSTRLRIVLAYHAALVQTIAETNPNGAKFLVLDTPAQHNISSEDLDGYVKALRKLAENAGIQVIFSTTEYRYKEQEGDITWTPTYEGFKQLMYLGHPS